MPDLLKDMYNKETVGSLATDIKSVYASFDTAGFSKAVFDETWDSLELKARVRHIATKLGDFLPTDYEQALQILDGVVANHTSFLGIVFPDFVEVYGQAEGDFELSISALKRYTPYSSSEFAVRPFIINHEEKMMKIMYEWAKDPDEHVRRLASEGCRPALPWGQALAKYKKDPSPILPILEKLKNDDSKYVQKSVANNLNDISKTRPEVVAEIAKRWYGENSTTNWIVKHGCRTLLKKGNPEVLAIFGYHASDVICVQDLSISHDQIAIGESLTFSFSLATTEATKVRLEYGIDYMKANGKQNRKIFQISETMLKAGEQKSYVKKHAFADLSTRKHYPGAHGITLIVNGVARGQVEFELSE